MFSIFVWSGGGAPKIDCQWWGPTRPRICIMLHLPKNGTVYYTK